MLSAKRRREGLIGLAMAGLLIGLFAACTPSHPQSTFDTSGPVARDQLALFWVILWAGVFVFVAVMAALLYAALKYRRKPGQGDPEQIHGHRTLEIAWTVAPAIILAVVAVPSIIAIFETTNSPLSAEEGGLVVEVIGHQWWFEFRYPGHEFKTANELHIPVDEVVNVKLDSADVIHSFWIPKIAGKVDMIPNNDNTLWLQADETGHFLGQCAEFCGVAHADMRFTVVVETREEFDAWLAEQAMPPVQPLDPLAMEGQAVFLSTEAGCRGCHTIDGTKARGVTGPNLTHFASRGHFAGATMESTQENLRRWLEHPETMKSGNLMARDGVVYNTPARALTEPQVSALIAYLRSLK